ncbi:exocyst complex component 1-like [Mytilus trossulus]|uniref:exocyst complex component 1-like n=1 Tax=Mytilus trossulus TaxID=6551 RepID=UPI0030060352
MELFVNVIQEEVAETGDIWMPRKEIPVIEVEHVAKRQINEEVRKMMGELFTNLEEELEGFIFYADKLDGFYSMYMLERMSQHVNNAQDAGSFISVTFASCLVKIERNFDNFFVYFEGVESKIASGVKPKEVGYQLAFSQKGTEKSYQGIFWEREEKSNNAVTLMMIQANL